VSLSVASQYHIRVLPLLPARFAAQTSSQVSVFTGLYHVQGAHEVSGGFVIEKSLSYMLLLMVPEHA
jgi:hypothetical protein